MTDRRKGKLLLREKMIRMGRRLVMPKPSIIFHETENWDGSSRKRTKQVGATLATHHSGVGTTKQLSARKIQRRER